MSSRLPGPRTPAGHLRAGLRIFRNPYDLTWLLDRYGPVSAVGYGPTRFVYLLGADANEFLLSSGHEHFRWREAFEMLIPVDGDTALVVTDGPEHARRRRLVQPAFALRRIESYRPIIDEEATAFVDRALTMRELDVHAEIKRCVRRIVIRTLFGDALGDRSEHFGNRMQVAIDFANLLPFLQRGRRRLTAMAATAELDEVIYAELARRRTDPGAAGGDLLASLLETELTDVEIRDQVVSLIAAGYDTTTAFGSWTTYEIARRPEVAERVRADDDAGTYLDAVLNESLRLSGPGPISTRYVPNGVDFAGHHIPAGTKVIWSPAVSHRDPAHWDEPLRFDPDRWLDGRTADVPAHVFVPFGGGYRRCIGFALATLEVKTIMTELFRRADVTVLDDEVKPTGLAAMYPKDGIRIRATRRTSPRSASRS